MDGPFNSMTSTYNEQTNIFFCLFIKFSNCDNKFLISSFSLLDLAYSKFQLSLAIELGPNTTAVETGVPGGKPLQKKK